MSDGNPHAPEQGSESGTPTPPLDRVRQEMERWLEVARTTGEKALETLGLGQPSRPLVPGVDVVELESEIVVLVDLPGVSAEFVNLSLVGNMLTVKASRNGMEFPETVRRHVFERTSTTFERAIPLPAAVDVEGIRAETRDGVLTVTLRKAIATPGRSIPVTRSQPKTETGSA